MKADEALAQIEYMRDLVRGTRFRAASGWPWFVLWGVIWVAGYVGTATLAEARADTLWSILIAVGATLSMLPTLLRSAPRFRARMAPPTELTRKCFRMNVALAFGLGLVLPGWILSLPDEAMTGAYPPFVIGLIYLVNGVFLGAELVAIGAWIVLTALIATKLDAPADSYVMAFAGGGGLLFTGAMFAWKWRTGR